MNFAVCRDLFCDGDIANEQSDRCRKVVRDLFVTSDICRKAVRDLFVIRMITMPD
jgi:hypothetical protein